MSYRTLVTVLSPNADHLRQRADKLARAVRLLVVHAELGHDAEQDALRYQVVYESPDHRGDPAPHLRRLANRMFRSTGPRDRVYIDILS